MSTSIKKTNLRVLESHYNKYLCECVNCETVQIVSKTEFKNSDSIYCKLCSKVKASNRILGDIERAKTLESRVIGYNSRIGSHVISNNQIQGMEKGKKIGDLTVKYPIAKTKAGSYAGQLLELPPHAVMLYCKRCNYHVEMSSTKLSKKKGSDLAKCPNCSDLIEKLNAEVKEYYSSKNSHDKVIEKNKNEKIQKIEPISRVKSQLDKINLDDNSKISTYIKTFNAKNNNLVVEDLVKEKSTLKLKTVCQVCGIENTVKVQKDANKVECEGCNELKQNLNFIGKYSRNWLGLTKNNLVVIEQKGLECNVRCKMCKAVKEKIRLYDILNGKVYCNCTYGNLDDIYYCDKCNKTMSIKLSSLIENTDNSKEIICNNCKEESGITYQEVINEQNASDLKSTTCNRLNISLKDYKNSVINTDNLIKDKESLYVGWDGKEYFRCRCINHNTDMILSETEIEMFSHKECYDSRQTLLDKLQYQKVRI